jgi:hypothetical protein
MEDAALKCITTTTFILEEAMMFILAAAKKNAPDRTFRTIQGQPTRIT